MDSIIDVISDLVSRALQYLYEILVTVIIDTLVNLLENVVTYFKQLGLEKGVHVPFLMDTSAETATPLSNLIPEDLKGQGVLEGVYNKNSDVIESLRYIGGNGIDNEVKNIMKDSPIVVLSD